MARMLLLILTTVLGGMVVQQKEPAITIKVKHSSCDIDPNGNIYTIDEALNMISYKGSADTFRIFSVTNYGFEPILDASNPLEVFVFYPSTGKCVYYDNQLNIQGELDFFAAGVISPVSFGRANDGNIWVFDSNTKTLLKLNRKGKGIQKSILLSQFAAENTYLRIFDNGKHIALYDRNNTVFIFDQNLILIKTIQKPGRLVGIENGAIIVEKEGYLMNRNIENRVINSDTVMLLPRGLNAVRYINGKVLLSDPETLFLYH